MRTRKKMYEDVKFDIKEDDGVNISEHSSYNDSSSQDSLRRK